MRLYVMISKNNNKRRIAMIWWIIGGVVVALGAGGYGVLRWLEHIAVDDSEGEQS